MIIVNETLLHPCESIIIIVIIIVNSKSSDSKSRTRSGFKTVDSSLSGPGVRVHRPDKRSEMACAGTELSLGNLKVREKV